MKPYHKKSHTSIFQRICSLVLCTVMLIGILPQTPIHQAKAITTSSISQSDALNKLVQWGVMRGDQDGSLSPERAITRAEFVTMLNRAFGYNKTGAQPFKDVVISDWFYDDISTAYNAGYFMGTDKTIASPNANLTREAAVVMLCRNIMLKEQSGENLSFTDSRTASSWSRGFIKAASDKGIVTGDPSGTFRPLANITRGEVAILLARVIGTPVQNQGTYSENISGNLMVSTSGVTLENMTVTGDLYITAGVGLGYVTLNNVNVYGQIIASGAGESNKGDCSIIIKNSTAPEMIVDSPSNQYVTIRTMGSTVIDKTYVRTDSYLEDKCTDDYGMLYIEVDGEEGTKLDLSGNIKEVITVTPKSQINVGSGTVKEMTIDEAATGSTVNIAQGAAVQVMNLDTATTVTGKGDIGSLYVNAPGCKVEMLPDYIYIRPGITANINGIEMDSTIAQQMSDAPRILTGYPRSDDIGPNQIITKFQTNKSGTIYWAIRLSGDGAMVADDIISPPSYGAKIIKNGNLAVSDANTTVEAKTTGLQLDTSYVISAVFVDSRGNKSPVKTLYFTTPDNSKPAFASGYPNASIIEDTYVVFDVATSKNCTLYWAIFKKGMTAPTANNFKDNVLSGAIDSGTVRMIKNEDDSITMGNILEDAKNALEELTDYDVYFFLTDSVNESNITKVSITTADRTPPEFLSNYPRIAKIDATALTGEAAINEDGKIYWVIVKHGTEYPLQNPALNTPEEILLDQKLQIKGGMYALKSGSVNGKEDTVVNINFSGLEAETAYDIYFVAEDNYGNFSDIESIKNAKTLDRTAPVLVEQKFSQANADGVPLADTDVTLVFSEDIYSTQTRMSLYEMYNSTEPNFTVYGSPTEKITFVDIIKNMFTLRNLDISDPKQQTVEFDIDSDNFKDRINVELTDEGLTEVTFKRDALNLLSGTNYQFTLNYISDSSNNTMGRDTKVTPFKTLDAQIDLNELTVISVPDSSGSGTVTVDTSFSMIPYANSTENASAESRYDVLIASDTTISFEVYRRERITDAGVAGNWSLVTNKDGDSVFSITHASGEWTALSLNHAEGLTIDEYNRVKDFPSDGFEYAIKLKSINLIGDSNKWNATVNLKIFCVSGSPTNLYNLSQGGAVGIDDWNNAINAQEVSSIGNPSDFSLKIVRVNQTAPQFQAQYPQAEPGDSVTKINFMLDREGELYYVVAPEERLKPTYEDGYGADPDNGGAEFDIGTRNATDFEKLLGEERNHHIASPSTQNIMNPSNYSTANGYRSGSVSYSGTGLDSIEVENLQPNSKYYIYFVLKGSYKDPSPVMVYTFSTGDVVSPILNAYANGSSAIYTIQPEEGQSAVSAQTYWKLYPYNLNSYPSIFNETFKINDEDVKVIDAIKDGSINYASSTDKERLWNLLSAPTSGSPAPVQSGNEIMTATSTSIAQNDVINPDELIPNTDYVMFVAAKNELGGEPVFAIVEGIRKHETVGPQITNISISSNSIKNDNGRFTGYVTIEFDQSIYVKQSGTTPPITKLYKTITKDEHGDLDPSITNHWDKDLIFTKINNESATISSVSDRQITVTLRTVPIQTIFSIVPNIPNYDSYFCSETGILRGDVSIKIQPLNDGTTNCIAVINGGTYDGLTSEIPQS